MSPQQRLEAAELARDAARERLTRAGQAIKDAHAAYSAAMDAVSAATDEVFAAREAIRQRARAEVESWTAEPPRA